MSTDCHACLLNRDSIPLIDYYAFATCLVFRQPRDLQGQFRRLSTYEQGGRNNSQGKWGAFRPAW